MRAPILSLWMVLVPTLAAPGLGPVPIGSEGPASDDGWLVAVRSASPALPRQLFAEGAIPVRVLEGFVLAMADDVALSRLRAAGFAVDALAPLAGRGPWYTLELPDPGPLADLDPAPRIVHRVGSEIVIEVAPATAHALAARGVDVARVFLRPVRLAGPPPPEGRDRRRELDFFLREAVDRVDEDRIIASVQRLQDFGTRYAEHDSCGAAAEWIAAELAACGVDSVSFHDWSGRYYPNVVGFVRGRSSPESVIVVGGHYDSAGGPGADDDASGIACMLECARVLNGLAFRNSIAYVAFCAEEQGLLGSEAYASDAVRRVESIAAMINLDMTAYCAPGDIPDLTLIANDASAWLLGRAGEARAGYAPGVPVSPLVRNNARSDHASFWAHGFPAIWIFEDYTQYSPFIHGPDDVVGISVNSPLRAGRAAKLVAATVGCLAAPDRSPAPAAAGSGATLVQAGVATDGWVLLVDRTGPFPVTLSIHDVAGRRLVTLLRGEPLPGRHSIRWDGRDARGRPVPEGIYFARLESADGIRATRILLRRP